LTRACLSGDDLVGDGSLAATVAFELQLLSRPLSPKHTTHTTMDDLYDECALYLPIQTNNELTLCDRFGNFIGEPEDSDVEQEQDVDANDYLYDQDDQDDAAAANDQQLMEVDGMRRSNGTMWRRN
jgi:hypothetical protein